MTTSNKSSKLMNVVIVAALVVGISYVAKTTGPDPFAITRHIFETGVGTVQACIGAGKEFIAQRHQETEEYKLAQERLARQNAGQGVIVMPFNGQSIDDIKSAFDTAKANSGKVASQGL